METLEELLARHRFFEGVAPDQLALIAGCGQNVHFRPGEMLFREGTPANELFVVREGTVRVEIASPKLGPIAIETVAPGDIVGWSWLVPPYVWQFDGQAIDPVRATVLDGACIRRKLEENPALGFLVLRRLSTVLASRLRSTRLRLAEALESAAEQDAR